MERSACAQRVPLGGPEGDAIPPTAAWWHGREDDLTLVGCQASGATIDDDARIRVANGWPPSSCGQFSPRRQYRGLDSSKAVGPPAAKVYARSVRLGPILVRSRGPHSLRPRRPRVCGPVTGFVRVGCDKPARRHQHLPEDLRRDFPVLAPSAGRRSQRHDGRKLPELLSKQEGVELSLNDNQRSPLSNCRGARIDQRPVAVRLDVSRPLDRSKATDLDHRQAFAVEPGYRYAGESPVSHPLRRRNRNVRIPPKAPAPNGVLRQPPPL